MGAVLLALALLAAAGPAAAQDQSPPPDATAPAIPPAAPAPPPPPPPAWLPRHGADLVALDKVAAQATPLSLDVGQSKTFGTLTIALRACDVRPPDVPADATAFLDITDGKAATPVFHGWMIASAPAVSAMQDPTYDVRLAGCH
jgi:hypothetical protein